MFERCDYNDNAADSGNSEIAVINEAEVITARLNLEKNKGNTTKNCLDCGCIIPAARRKFIPNCKFCVKCQGENDDKPRRSYVITGEEEEEEILPETVVAKRELAKIVRGYNL